MVGLKLKKCNTIFEHRDVYSKLFELGFIFFSNNISMSSAYGAILYQLVKYARACYDYQYFVSTYK